LIQLVRRQGAGLNGEVWSLAIAEVTKTLPEGIQGAAVPESRHRREHADTWPLPRWLHFGSERRGEQAQGQYHDASEGATPHRHFLAWASCRPASCLLPYE